MAQLTAHPIERFIERIAPGMSPRRAARILAREARTLPPTTVYAAREWGGVSYGITLRDGHVTTVVVIGSRG